MFNSERIKENNIVEILLTMIADKCEYQKPNLRVEQEEWKGFPKELQKFETPSHERTTQLVCKNLRPLSYSSVATEPMTR